MLSCSFAGSKSHAIDVATAPASCPCSCSSPEEVEQVVQKAEVVLALSIQNIGVGEYQLSSTAPAMTLGTAAIPPESAHSGPVRTAPASTATTVNLQFDAAHQCGTMVPGLKEYAGLSSATAIPNLSRPVKAGPTKLNWRAVQYA